MFDQIHQQNLADMIKGNALRISTPQRRKLALEAIQAFERAPWYPQVFERAVQEVCQPGEFIFDGSSVSIEREAARIVPRLLYHYLALINNEQPLKLKDAQKWLADHHIGRKDGEPYTRIAIQKAIERGELAAHFVEGIIRYRVVERDDLIAWALDADQRRPGPKTDKE